MEELILVKLGGSVITNKKREFTPKEGVIRRLAWEIKSARKKMKAEIILAHGSGSFGHAVAAKYRTKEGMINEDSFTGFPLVADAAALINRIVIKNFLKVGLPVVAFSPLSLISAAGQKVAKVFFDPIEKALDLGFLPVLYGDVIMDSKKGFCIFSSEKLLSILAGRLKDKHARIRIIYCGDTDGVYDERGKTIGEINGKNFSKFEKAITGSAGMDVTGGMIHKIKEALALAGKYRIETLIINGTKKGVLGRALLGVRVVRGTTVKR